MSGLIVQQGHWGPGKLRRLPPHRNAGLELVLITGGRLVWQIEGRIEHVEAGSVFFTFPWEMHGSIVEREAGCSLWYVVLRLDRTYRRPARRFGFDPRLHLGRASARRVNAALTQPGPRCRRATQRMTWILPGLVEASGDRDSAPEAVASLAALALLEIPRCGSSDARANPGDPASMRVAKFLERLSETCHQPWTLDTMAQACEMRRTAFARHLADLSGDRPVMALNRARVTRAQGMLRTNAQSITDVAMACGFGSSQHFARVFREYVGLTPRAFRASVAAGPRVAASEAPQKLTRALLKRVCARPHSQRAGLS
jgi:AraC family L-rhamnose operon regulatory protein RhaS